MKFVALSLERYGLFSDRQLQFRADARLHILHGANEAGKTSTLIAISDLLFGFGASTPYAFLHANETLRLGAILRLADGTQLEFRRRKGKVNTLIDRQDRPLPDTLLAPITGTLSRKRFQDEYGLTAAALRAGGGELLKTGGKLAEMLAAGSAGLSALSRLAGVLEAEAEDLFGERKAIRKPFYVAASGYGEADKLMKSLIVTGEAWKTANVEVATAATALLEAEAAQKQLAVETTRLNRARATSGILRRIDTIRANLAGVATFLEIDQATLPLWQATVDGIVLLVRDQAALLETRDGTLHKLSGLHIDQALLDAGHDIEALSLRLGAIDQAEDDLPNRIADRDLAARQLAELARSLHFADAAILLAGLPDTAALERAGALTARARAASSATDKALRRLSERQAALKRFDEAGAPLAHLIDPAPFKIRVDALVALAHEPSSLRAQVQALASEDQRLSDLLARLTPSPGEMDRAIRLCLPESADISRAHQAIATQERDAAKLVAVGDGFHTKITAGERDIADMSVQGEVLTSGTLAQARSARDVALHTLQAVLNGPPDARQARFETLQALMQRADDVADQLIRSGDRAARRLLAEQQLLGAQQELAAHQKVQAAQIARQQSAQADWQAIWAPTGLVALQPAPMLLWMEKLAEILRQHEVLRQKRIVLATMQASHAEMRPVLAALAVELGLVVRASEPLDQIYTQAVAQLAQVQDAWNISRARVAEGKELARNLDEADADLVQCQDEDANWRAQWPAMLAKLGQSGETDADAADIAIGLWTKVENPRQKLADAEYRIAGIEDRRDKFQKDVVKITENLAADVLDQPPRKALDALKLRLETTGKADILRQHFATQLLDYELKIDDLARQRTKADAVIAQAQQILGVTGDIIPALEALALRQKLHADMREAEKQLQEAGDGYTQDALRAEQADIDPDQIKALIDASTIRAEAARQAFAQAYSQNQRAVQLRDELARGSNADEALQASVEAAADMVRIGEGWLVRSAAVRLARTAIQLHRARVQDPVIAYASALFATITGGSFSGLTLAYDTDDQPKLVGQRANGDTVKVGEMSEGTSDQLFLVLRLALLAQSTHELMPFIGDDLLASFDEARTAQALDLLAEIGTNRQVLLFTHHAHVVEIAQARLGARLDLIAL